MIETLFINNFQAHKKLKIDFDKITTIIGPNDAGKSTILRSLQWVLCNDAPRDFISWNEEEAKVRLLIDERSITRKREKSLNSYLLDDKEFKAFSTDVPPEIAALINIDTTNIQNQFDSPYWLADSAGEISRQLNKIINLTEIDVSLSNIGSMLRKVRGEVETSQTRLEENENEKKKLEWIEEVDKVLTKLEEKEQKLLKISQDLLKLKEITKSVRESTVKLDRLSKQILANSSLFKIVERSIETAQKIANMKNFLGSIQIYQTRMETIENKMSKLQEEMEEKFGERCPICGKS